MHTPRCAASCGAGCALPSRGRAEPIGADGRRPSRQVDLARPPKIPGTVSMCGTRLSVVPTSGLITQVTREGGADGRGRGAEPAVPNASRFPLQWRVRVAQGACERASWRFKPAAGPGPFSACQAPGGMAAYHHLKAPAAAYSVNGIGLHHGSPGVDLLHPGYPGHPPIRLDKYRDEWDSQMIEEVWYGSSGCPRCVRASKLAFQPAAGPGPFSACQAPGGMAAYHHLKAPAAAYSVNGIGLHHGSPGVDLLHPGYPGHPPIRLDKYRDEWDSQMIEEVWYGSSGCPSESFPPLIFVIRCICVYTSNQGGKKKKKKT
ncbi:homeobox protein OTX2 [Ixodes scapularis]